MNGRQSQLITVLILSTPYNSTKIPPTLAHHTFHHRQWSECTTPTTCHHVLPKKQAKILTKARKKKTKTKTGIHPKMPTLVLFQLHNYFNFPRTTFRAKSQHQTAEYFCRFAQSDER